MKMISDMWKRGKLKTWRQIEILQQLFFVCFWSKVWLKLETTFHSTLLANHQEEKDMLSYFIPTQSMSLYPSPFYLSASPFSSLPSGSTLCPCSFPWRILQSTAEHIFWLYLYLYLKPPRSAHVCHFFRPSLQRLWVGFIISLNKSHSPLDISCFIFFFRDFVMSFDKLCVHKLL